MKNWFSNVWNFQEAINNWESFKSLLLEKFSESLKIKICDLSWLKLLMYDEFFMIEIESFSSKHDYCIIFKTECFIYFINILFVWFNLFYYLKFFFVFLMFLHVILSENMFGFFFDIFFEKIWFLVFLINFSSAYLIISSNFIFIFSIS